MQIRCSLYDYSSFFDCWICMALSLIQSCQGTQSQMGTYSKLESNYSNIYQHTDIIHSSLILKLSIICKKFSRTFLDFEKWMDFNFYWTLIHVFYNYPLFNTQKEGD